MGSKFLINYLRQKWCDLQSLFVAPRLGCACAQPSCGSNKRVHSRKRLSGVYPIVAYAHLRLCFFISYHHRRRWVWTQANASVSAIRILVLVLISYLYLYFLITGWEVRWTLNAPFFVQPILEGIHSVCLDHHA